MKMGGFFWIEKKGPVPIDMRDFRYVWWRLWLDPRFVTAVLPYDNQRRSPLKNASPTATGDKRNKSNGLDPFSFAAFLLSKLACSGFSDVDRNSRVRDPDEKMVRQNSNIAREFSLDLERRW